MPGFFDKMKQGLGDTVMQASIKSKEALETQQIRSKISGLQNQKKTAFEELGTSVYNMYIADNLDQEDIKAKCDAITALDAEIKEKEAEVEAVHARAQAALSEGAEPAAPAAVPSAVSAAKNCECGTPIEPGVKFCPNCGKRQD